MYKFYPRIAAIAAISTACVCANAGNLLLNGDFSTVGANGSTVTSTNLFPGPCAAADWETFQNQPNTATYTGLIPPLSPPSTPCPSGTATMIYFGAPEGHTNVGSELDQVFAAYGTGPGTVQIGAWVYVISGLVGIGSGHGGATGYEVGTTLTDQWVYLSTTSTIVGGNDNFIIGNAGSDTAKFFATNVSVDAVPEPAPFAALGLGAGCLLIRRRRAR